MFTTRLPCHENPICLILPIGQQLPNYHKVLQLYKYGIKEIESCLQNLKEGQECVENICDLIIILCQSANGNATTVLESRNLLKFSFELSGTLTSHPPSPYSLTSLKSSSMSTRLHQKKILFILSRFFWMIQALKCKFQTKSSLQTVLHPNLCVCFHSAVTFWLNDRLSVYCRTVNWLYNKSPPHHHQTKQIYCPLWLYVCLSDKCPPLTVESVLNPGWIEKLIARTKSQGWNHFCKIVFLGVAFNCFCWSCISCISSLWLFVFLGSTLLNIFARSNILPINFITCFCDLNKFLYIENCYLNISF